MIFFRFRTLLSAVCRQPSAVSVTLVACVCAMAGLHLGYAQWGDFLRPESPLRPNATSSTDTMPDTTTIASPAAAPAQPVAPSSQNHIADDGYRLETASIEVLLTPREQHYIDRLIELGLTDLAEFYCRKRIASDSVSPAQEAGYTRALLQSKKQELFNATPQNRSLVWEQIERLCTGADARFADTPYAAAVLLQQINVRLAYAELLMEDAMADEVATRDTRTGKVLPQVAEGLDGTLALMDAELQRSAQRSSQRSADQPASPTTSREVSRFGSDETAMPPMLAQLFRFRKAVALRLLARCRPEQNAGLTAQALAILQTLSDPRQGELSVFAAFETLACFRMTQQENEAASLAEQLRDNDFLTPRQRAQVSAVDLLLALDRRDENRVHSALRAVETALQQGQPTPRQTAQQAVIDVPELSLAQLQAYLFFWKRNIETQSSLPQIVGTTSAPNIDECRRRVLEITQRLRRDGAPYWHRRAERVLLAESRFFGNDPVFVEQRADAFAREGRIDEAVERYDRLAAAASATNPAESFRLAKKAADLLAAGAEANHDLQELIDRYRKLAVAHPQSIDAIDAHLAAVYYAGRRLQDGDESRLEDYLSLLREHVQTWPHSKQADSLRVQSARLLMHEAQYRDAIDALAPLTNRSPVAPDAIHAADDCFEFLRLARPDANATLESEAVAWFYRRLLNADGRVVADWNDADAQCLTCMAHYGLLYADVVERNPASNPGVNLSAMHQLVERMLLIGLANYKHATPEWRASVDSMLLCVLVAQGRTDEAAQILQTMRQWEAAPLAAALERLQQRAEVSPAIHRRTLGAMRLDIVDILERQLPAAGVAPSNVVPPNVAPSNVAPSNAVPSNAVPPNVAPPNVAPSNAASPNAVPPNTEPPIRRRRLDVIRADALADAGRPQEAVDLLGHLLRQSPGEMELLVPLARILERQPDAPSLETALNIWRSVERRSPKYSEAWWDAKEAVLRLLMATGDRREAESAFQMLQILNPELGGPERKPRWESLFR